MAGKDGRPEDSAVALRAVPLEAVLAQFGLPPVLLCAAATDLKELEDSTAGSAEVLLLVPTGSSMRLSGGENATVVELSSLPSASVDAVLALGILPTPAVPPLALLGQLREASRALRPGGKLCIASDCGPTDAFRTLLGLPVLQLDVAAHAPEAAGPKQWVYVCTRREEAAEGPPVPGAVQVVLETSARPAGAPGSSAVDEWAVWTRNPEEASFEYKEMFDGRCYGPVEDDGSRWGLDLPDVEDASIVVDAGMNLGLFCIYLQRLLGSSRARGRVQCLAFEPAPESYQVALRNLREAGISVVDHGASLPATPEVATAAAAAAREQVEGSDLVVHAFQMALSSQPAGTVERFLFFPRSSANSALARHRPEARWRPGEVPASQELEVPCCRLSEVLSAVAGPTGGVFLKVDVEGAEAEVLRGVEAADWPRVWGLATEVQGAARLQEVTELCRHGLAASAGGPGRLLVRRQPGDLGESGEELFMLYGRRG